MPLIPNALTAARRGRPVSGQGVGEVSRVSGVSSQSTCGVGAVSLGCAGSSPWRIARIILMMAVTPAAAWVCPRLALIEPR